MWEQLCPELSAMPEEKQTQKVSWQHVRKIQGEQSYVSQAPSSTDGNVLIVERSAGWRRTIWSCFVYRRGNEFITSYKFGVNTLKYKTKKERLNKVWERSCDLGTFKNEGSSWAWWHTSNSSTLEVEASLVTRASCKVARVTQRNLASTSQASKQKKVLCSTTIHSDLVGGCDDLVAANR